MQVTGFICQRKGQGFWGQPTEESFRETRLEGGLGFLEHLGQGTDHCRIKHQETRQEGGLGRREALGTLQDIPEEGYLENLHKKHQVIVCPITNLVQDTSLL